MKSKNWFKFLLFLSCVALLVIMLPMMVHGQVGDIEAENKRWYAIAASVVLGLAALGAALGMGNAAASAMGAITEKPEVFDKTMIFIVMLEAIAIYGLVIAILLIGFI